MPNIKSIKCYMVVGNTHCGMTLASLDIIGRLLKSGKNQTVYVNFELPKLARETIVKYASIEIIHAKH